MINVPGREDDPRSGGLARQGPGALIQEEGMMVNRRQARSGAVILLILCSILFYGCAGVQTATQDQVVNEYLLTKAGFKPYQSTMETPKIQALLNAIPKGQITTFRADGKVYHAYPDENSHVVYVGTPAAYQNYLALAQGRNVCRRVDAQNSAGFWNCFDEFQKTGGLPGAR
jgi:hypothetical protein